MKKLFIILFILFLYSYSYSFNPMMVCSGVPVASGEGELGQTASNNYIVATDDTLLYYTTFTATPGDTTYAHFEVSSIGGNGTTTTVYLFTSTGTYVDSWASDALWAGVVGWVNITMAAPETLSSGDYILGWMVDNDSSFNVYRNPSGGNGLYSIGYTYGATTDITPGSATEIDPDAELTIILNNTSGDPT